MPAVGEERVALRHQLGQLLVSSFLGPALPDYLRRRLRAGETTGVILFGGNVPTGPGAKRLTAAIQRAAGGGALVTTDQEGGAIRSLAFADSAQEVRAAGVNVNLAPVADVAQPGSVMLGRAFTGDVAGQTVAALRELLDARVLPTVKHFPGLGRARENTDDAPVTIDATLEELDTDLAPFEAAVDADVPLVMASHALYPALDHRRIASQSRTVLGDLLRRRLGFRGVVVTDSIEADAVLARSSVETAAVRSVAAGADIVLMTGPGSFDGVRDRLLARARRSARFRRRVEDSAQRVLVLKDRMGLGRLSRRSSAR